MLSNWKHKSKREKGIAVLMTAGLLFLIVPVAGLAVDGGIAYVLKTRLSSATDAAALAAARSLNVGLTLPEQEAEAEARALDFFDSNFKDGSYGTKNLIVDAVVAEAEAKTRTVTVTAAFDAPQYFMRLLGFDKIRIAALGQASRRDVNLILVLDRSGSMQTGYAAGDPNSPCAKMREAAKYFVDLFAEGRDRLGMVTFSTGYFPAYAPTMNFKTGSPTLKDRIDDITCAGWTGTGSAISVAYQHIKDIDEEGALNVILLFTDGNANTVIADYPIKKLSDTRYGESPGFRAYSSTTKTFSGSTSCNYDNSSCSMEPSPCKDAAGNQWDRNSGQIQRTFYSPTWNPNWAPDPIRAAIAGGDFDSTGNTSGLMKHISTTITSDSEYLTNAGCAFSTSGFLSNNGQTSSQRHLLPRRDIAYMPDKDIYDNDTSGYLSVSTFTSGNYNTKKRIDRPIAVTNAAFNVADNLAKTAREDAAFAVVFYTIGLGDVDHVFLRRIANDPASPIYDENLHDGIYVYAPDQNKLKDAFARIAGEILRISL